MRLVQLRCKNLGCRRFIRYIELKFHVQPPEEECELCAKPKERGWRWQWDD